MKHIRRWTGLALALGLLLSGVASAAESAAYTSAEAAALTVVTPAPTPPAPAFQVGITWEMGVDGVLEAMGALSPDDYKIYDGDGYRNYIFERGTGEQSIEIGYGFVGDQMVFFIYYRESGSADAFDGMAGEFSAEYGEPAETDAKHLVELMNRLEEGSLYESDPSAVAGWALSDGTMAYLMELNGDAYVIYLNEPVILSLSAAAASAVKETAFTFYNGVTWAASAAEMLAAENAADGNDYRETTLGDYRMYSFADRQVGGRSAETAYYYLGDQLAIAGVSYDMADPDALYAQEDVLRAAYGKPAEKDWAKMASTLSFLFDGQTVRRTMSDLSDWELADGTWVFLFTMDDEEIYVLYCNASIFPPADAASAADAAEPGAVPDFEFDAADLAPLRETPGPETAFTFYNGLGWDSAVEQTLSAEGAEEAGEYDRYTYGGCDFLEFEDRLIGGETADISYVYHNGWPIAMGITYDSGLLRTYTDRLAELCAQYGYPSETNANHVAKLYLALGSAYGWEDFQIVTGWTLADGTCAYLLVIDDTIYNVFLHEKRILNAFD